MSQSNQAPSGKTQPPGEPPRLIGAAIALALAVLITAVAQYFAPSFDHQNANLIGLGALSIATFYVLFCLHRLMRWSGHPWGVPAAMLVAAVSFGAAFRFDGFSGEMLPQFRWRFAGATARELKTVTSDAAEITADAASHDTTTPDTTTTDESTESSNTLVVSPQFLGPNRNGVYPQRTFAKPTSADQVHVVWEHGIGDGWSSFAVAADHAITLEQRDDQECLTCYRLSDGELIWMQQHQGLHQNPLGGVGPRSTPTIAGDRVYATTATGFLWCVDQATGAVHWSRDLLELAGWDQVAFEVAAPWGYACSPLLVDGLCVLPLGGPVGEKMPVRSLAALDAQSGDLVWTAGEDQLSYASPVLVTLDGQRQIVSVNEKTVSGHRIEDGVVLWTFQWPGSTNTGATCSSAVPVGDDQLLVGKGYGGGSALVRVAKQGTNWSATDVWRSNRVLKTKFNHTCVDGDIGYGISNGSLQAVNLNDATSYWTQPRRWRAGQGQVVLVEDVLVVQDEAGEVVFVDASIEDYHELLRIPALDSKTWNIPTVAGRYLLVRNDRQAICFQLPAK